MPDETAGAVAAEVHAPTPEGQVDETTQAPAPESENAVADWESEDNPYKQRYKSLQGSQSVRLSGSDVLAKLDSLEAEMHTDRWERQREKWENDPYVDSATKSEKLHEIDQREQKAVLTASVKSSRVRMEEAISVAFDEAGLTRENPKVQAIVDRWENTTDMDGYITLTLEANALVVAEERRQKVEGESASKKESEEARQQYLGDTGAMNVGAGTGIPSGSNLSWAKVRDAYIEDPTDPKISKQYYEMRRAKGL